MQYRAKPTNSFREARQSLPTITIKYDFDKIAKIDFYDSYQPDKNTVLVTSASISINVGKRLDTLKGTVLDKPLRGGGGVANVYFAYCTCTSTILELAN